jgi:SAM-dependent methyltransferase
MADTIRPYVQTKVLEIGAGMGNLTRTLDQGRQRYIASDIDREHLSRLQTRLQHHLNVEVRPCDLSNSADFQQLAGAVDTVICLNVLEHMEDDLGALRNIYNALSPGGRAIVLVPCGQEVYGQLDVILGHFRRYSDSQLRSRFEQAGFEIERILDFNHISRPGWYITGKLLKRSHISRFQLKIFDRLVWLWRRIDRFIPWEPTSLIAIAAKPKVKAAESRPELDVPVVLASQSGPTQKQSSKI